MVSIDISLLGQRLQKARKDMGLELSVLSSKVGITQESLRHIEHGIRNRLFHSATIALPNCE